MKKTILVAAALILSFGVFAKDKKAKPLFTSKVVTNNTSGHAVEISANIKGAPELHLLVGDGGNGYGCDWANWIDPHLVDASGK